MHFAAFRVSAVLSAASLAACVAVFAPGTALAQQQPPHPAAAGAAHPAAAAATPAKDDHPKMEAAQQALAKAKSELASAAHDYDGHRKKALELVDQASEQIRLGLASDK